MSSYVKSNYLQEMVFNKKFEDKKTLISKNNSRHH